MIQQSFLITDHYPCTGTAQSHDDMTCGIRHVVRSARISRMTTTWKGSSKLGVTWRHRYIKKRYVRNYLKLQNGWFQSLIPIGQ